MRKSFRTKVIVVFLIGIVLAMLFMSCMSTVLLKSIFVSNSKHMMENYAVKIEDCLRNAPDSVNRLLEEINVSYGITGRVTDSAAETLYSYSSNVMGETIYNVTRKLIRSYEEKDRNNSYYFRERLDEADNIRKITYVGKTVDNHYIILTKAIKGIEQNIKLVSMFLVFMGIVVAIVGAIIWSVFTKPFTNQIKKMSVITDKMARLNFDEKINYIGDDEIGMLAQSIDMLSEELKTSIEDLKEDVERRKRLVRDISHEIKTPITTIRGYVENIQLFTKDDKKINRYCEIAIEECDEIDSLVEEMLEMSYLESDRYECDMEKIPVKDVFDIIDKRLDTEYQGIKIKTDYQQSEVYCNKILISRAVLNFVKNAVKYGKKESEIHVSGTLEEEKYIFSVKNKGIDISQKEKELFWDLFYKNDKSRTRDRSHGIGLPMVSQIARLHGGSVGLESEEGNTIFFMWIPLEKR